MKIVLVFPFYNEATSLRKYMPEIIDGLGIFNCQFVLIDDVSTDSTLEILEELKEHYSNVMVLKNKVNLGHGPTVVKGLKFALSQKPNLVISCDGDGEVKVADFQKAIHTFRESNVEILEGTRKQRNFDYLRFIVSAVARIIVLIKSGRSSKDANTPFRAYKPEVLEKLLSAIPNSTLIPNIWISIHSRKLGSKIYQIDIYPDTSIQSVFHGSSWTAKTRLGSRIKFMRFAFKSFMQILKF